MIRYIFTSYLELYDIDLIQVFVLLDNYIRKLIGVSYFSL